MQNIFKVLPGQLRQLIEALPPKERESLMEIRLRSGRPLAVTIDGKDRFLSPQGVLIQQGEDAFLVSTDQMVKTIQLISNSSVYAFEEELRNGFLTIPGGHRVGIAGKVVLDKGYISTITHISGLNIRVAREFPGAADKVLPVLLDRRNKTIYHTLIISPPCCGKTTLLRDLVRQVSNGIPSLGFGGITVGLVDERSEIAGCYKGIPQLNVGVRTDVLDGCPKAQGMMLMIRSMSPGVLAVDEIGRKEDVEAVEEALNAGIRVIATVHGSTMEDIYQRPHLRCLLEQGIFQRFILLNNSRGIGTVTEVLKGLEVKAFKRGEHIC